jgi:hypothetical protein
MAAPDYAPMLFKNRLHLAGRPQMSTRPKTRPAPRQHPNEGTLGRISFDSSDPHRPRAHTVPSDFDHSFSNTSFVLLSIDHDLNRPRND